MTLTEGQVSDYKGATLLMDALPEARELLADRGYDADWSRDALLARGITPCIPPRKNRKRPISYDKNLYKQRHKIEIMFGRIKDWRRIAEKQAEDQQRGHAHRFQDVVPQRPTFGLGQIKEYD